MRCGVGLLLVFALGLPGVGVAQTPTASGQTPATQSASAVPSTTTASTEVPSVTPPTAGYAYNPEGRRDPFVSLIRRGGDTAATPTARPAGLLGLGIGETTLKGILVNPDGLVAMLQGSDQKTYIVRASERLLDGSIRTITRDAVVFVQDVDDPLSREKRREVRKVLRQTEEAK